VPDRIGTLAAGEGEGIRDTGTGRAGQGRAGQGRTGWNRVGAEQLLGKITKNRLWYETQRRICRYRS
jgi:hypothetical protein